MKWHIIILWCLCIVSAFAWDLPDVHDSPVAGDFIIAENGKAASILVDPREAKVVRFAADQLASDIATVTNVDSRKNSATDAVIIVGSIDSPLIKEAAKAGGIDLTKIKGAWESFHIEVVANPLPMSHPEITRAILVIGSDRRGTAYGVFSLSEAIGVSPWYWWADVHPLKKSALYLTSSSFDSGSPSVKYRGIFINDEDWGMQPWAAKTFEKIPADIGPKTYAKVFELMLRLRTNLIWPAMHPCTKAFNFYPENKQLADDYAIVVGSSHCEPMLRNNVNEWDAKIRGEWNYATNREKVVTYWEERVRANAAYESIYTMGMRGIHDGAMPGGGTLDEKARRLGEIIADQRSILSQSINLDATQVPQMFCPYKEVLPIYRRGVKIPDDVTLVWADDNHGYLRQLPNPEERKRSGGSGIYYHLSYWGAPADYLWLSSISPAQISTEMTKAWQLGADRIWVINVGDIKPAEKELSFVMELAWNVKRWPPEKAHQFTRDWAARTFGIALADEIAGILNPYYRLAQSGKPEHVDKLDFAPAESEARLAEYRVLAQKAQDLVVRVPDSLKDAYFELVLYPVAGAAWMNEKHLLARRGDEFKAAVKDADLKIQKLTRQYNESIAGGKWRLMMSSHPRKQPVFDLPKTTVAAPTHDPVLTIPAAQFTDKLEREFGRFVMIPGLSEGGVALAPVTAPSFTVESAPRLMFEAKLPMGQHAACFRFLPTQPLYSGRHLRAAISINGTPLREIDIEAGEMSTTWKANVLRGYAEASVEFTTTTDATTIEIRFIDPGLVLTETRFY